MVDDVDYDDVGVVCEGGREPCVNYLMDSEGCNFYSGEFSEDIELLLNASDIVIGRGTFGFAMYLLNPSLKKLFMQDYPLDFLPKGDRGDIELIKFA